MNGVAYPIWAGCIRLRAGRLVIAPMTPAGLLSLAITEWGYASPMRRPSTRATRPGRATLAGAVTAALLVACTGDDGGAVDGVGDAELTAQQIDQDRATGGVTVVGEGRASAVPDTARMLVGVEVTRLSVDAAFSEANDAMDDILDELREQGVASQDLRTQELSVRERRDDRPPAPPSDDPPPTEPPERPSPDDPPPARPPDPTQPPDDEMEEVEVDETNEPEVVGYAVTNLVEVTIRDLDRAGELISAVVDAGGSAVRIQRYSLDVEDQAGLLDGARSAAFADAERRAEQYADLAGRDLGDLVAISEVLGSPGPGPVPEIALDAGVGAPIEPGQQEAVVRIQTTWALG